MTTIAVVPAFNEAGRVGPTVASLNGLPVVTDVVVIDDGSTDDTAAQARAAGACCLSLPRNVGKGDALNAGVALVRHRIVDGLVGVPDVLLLADADLAETAGELLRLIDALDDERVDMAIADLPAQGSTGFGLAKALAALHRSQPERTSLGSAGGALDVAARDRALRPQLRGGGCHGPCGLGRGSQPRRGRSPA